MYNNREILVIYNSIVKILPPRDRWRGGSGVVLRVVDIGNGRMDLAATDRLVGEKHESVRNYSIPVDRPPTTVIHIEVAVLLLINREIVVGVVGEFVRSHERWPSCGCWSGRTHQEIAFNNSTNQKLFCLLLVVIKIPPLLVRAVVDSAVMK